MANPLLVELSRLQFALTAMYHFLFVPLTLGLSVLVAMMETVYVMTARTVWRDMTKFWGLLFGINFVLGVATGITMEFEFGMNWAFYSHYVGDIFGAPLAIEGLMAFFLEATFVGLFFFGWERMSPRAHLAATWMVALGKIPSGPPSIPTRCAWRSPISWRFCSIRPRRRNSCTRSRQAMSAAPPSFWAFQRSIFCGAVTSSSPNDRS
jgi:hypothetical protein